jgi:hypothetical protein
MVQALISITFRFPKEVWEFLKRDAERNYRSMNAHVTALLKERRRQIEGDTPPPHGQ